MRLAGKLAARPGPARRVIPAFKVGRARVRYIYLDRSERGLIIEALVDVGGGVVGVAREKNDAGFETRPTGYCCVRGKGARV